MGGSHIKILSPRPVILEELFHSDCAVLTTTAHLAEGSQKWWNPEHCLWFLFSTADACVAWSFPYSWPPSFQRLGRCSALSYYSRRDPSWNWECLCHSLRLSQQQLRGWGWGQTAVLRSNFQLEAILAGLLKGNARQSGVGWRGCKQRD